MWHTGNAVRTLLKERGGRAEDLMDWLGVSRPTAFVLLRRDEWSEAYRRLAAPKLGVTADWLAHGDGDAPAVVRWDARADVQAAVRRAEERVRTAMEGALAQLRDDLGRIAGEYARGQLSPAPDPTSRIVSLDERRLASLPPRSESPEALPGSDPEPGTPPEPHRAQRSLPPR